MTTSSIAIVPPLTVERQYGLEWEQTLFSLEPRWTVEPDVDQTKALSRKHLCLSPEDDCSVALFNQGTFNKLYKVETNIGTWAMRVLLPVDPSRKTISEVTTIQFLRERTTIPVPGIVAYDASN